MQAPGSLGLLMCHFFSYNLIPLPFPLPFILINGPRSSDYSSREPSTSSNSEQDTLVLPVCVSVSLLDRAQEARDRVLVLTVPLSKYLSKGR